MTRELYHAVCHSCASDPEAREETGTDEYRHETLTRNEAFAKWATEVHQGFGHDAEYLQVRA